MPKPAVDITPADSIVPVYLEEPTDEELAERQAEHEKMEAERLAHQEKLDSALAKLKKLGLTEDEAKAVIGL